MNGLADRHREVVAVNQSPKLTPLLLPAPRNALEIVVLAEKNTPQLRGALQQRLILELMGPVFAGRQHVNTTPP